MYDIIIVGSGPAGLSAAITARARDKKVLVVSNKPQESPLARAKLVDNYPGLSRVSGRQLLEQMIAHAHDLGVRFIYERVISVLPMNGYLAVVTGGASIETRAVILATGQPLGKPIAGETEFLGRGVSYCATCDGMLYRGQTVCVVGMNNEAVDEANFLSGIGTTVVFLAKESPYGLREGIVVRTGTPVEVKGNVDGVTEIVFKASRSGREEVLSCGGVFILRPTIALDALMSGLAISDGHIAVDSTMSTNKEGVFAAGDCIGRPLQVAKAVGDGQRACFSAVAYLDQNTSNS
ncbi:MAG: NAD(P)/FAD-dependent oxidoreductase [Coriobacteriales bacterium]|jgi:thioredoxin reductase (NADPH)|nr:NAD(P)/FAD-dependent oxidoreductase [Coriobacteriales bacterium]